MALLLCHTSGSVPFEVLEGDTIAHFSQAPIKLMLQVSLTGRVKSFDLICFQIASHHRNVFEALLAAYADIGNSLPRFDRYEKAFIENLEFQNVLAAVYCGILEFHQQAYKFLRRKGKTAIFFVRPSIHVQ